MAREIDKLEDNSNYKALVDLMGFCKEGDEFTGKEIKDSCPYDVSPNQGVDSFFKKIK